QRPAPKRQPMMKETMTHAYPTHDRYTEPTEAARHGTRPVRADDHQRRPGPGVRGTTRAVARARGNYSGQPTDDAAVAARDAQIQRRSPRVSLLSVAPASTARNWRALPLATGSGP